jgi:Kef-type K+ transport system membrane component KefB
VAWVFGFGLNDAVLVGAAMMFSSTIIGVKLLPTTALHHQHVGEIIISVLLLQDIIAIIVLLLLEGYSRGGGMIIKIALILVYLPGLIGFAFLFERYVLIKLIRRFDKIQEYIFLVAIGWCLGMAELAAALGLSAEIGAFIAGVALATSPIALFIAQSLRPLRDFFLVMFFFALGAGLDLSIVSEVILPAIVLAAIALVIKPALFKWLLRRTGETAQLSREIGVRLGQISEFSLLIAVLAVNSSFIDNTTSYLIQIATLLTFIVSSYWVVLRYPTPIAISDKLRRD